MRLHPSIQLPCPFVFYRFYSAILIFREHHRHTEKRYRYIDRSIRAWIFYRQKLITFRKYTVRFSWIAFVSIGLSTYRNLDYPVYCCFAFFSLSLCHSIFVSRFSCLRRVRVTWRNWSSPDWRCKPRNMEAIYNLALFFIWWYLKSGRTKGEEASSASYAEFTDSYLQARVRARIKSHRGMVFVPVVCICVT